MTRLGVATKMSGKEDGKGSMREKIPSWARIIKHRAREADSDYAIA
jgi:hypothetical protein